MVPVSGSRSVDSESWLVMSSKWLVPGQRMALSMMRETIKAKAAQPKMTYLSRVTVVGRTSVSRVTCNGSG